MPRTATSAELQKLVSDLKSVPCPDCVLEGRDPNWPWWAMQFDHRPGSGKQGNIRKFVASGDREALLLEISKCDVVCANHHFMRTHSRPVSEETREKLRQAKTASSNLNRSESLKEVNLRKKNAGIPLQRWTAESRAKALATRKANGSISEVAKLGWKNRRMNRTIEPTERDSKGHWVKK